MSGNAFRILVLVLGLAAGLGSARGGNDPSAADPPPVDPIVERLLAWNEAFLEAIQAESTPPCLAARNLALLHLAIHDALNLADPRDAPWIDPESIARAVPDASVPDAIDANPASAAFAAAHRVASALCPSRVARFDALLGAGARETGGDPASGGAALGRAVADAVLARRRDDGATLSVHYTPSEAPGAWRRTTRNRPPELPQWPRVRPFVLDRADALRPPGPPPLDSPEYAAALDDVLRLGGAQSASRTAEQTLIARFWADFTHTSTPPGHWNEIARDAVRRSGGEHRPHAVARLFMLLNAALADAGIAAFDAKFHFNFWRPVTAAARADEDGNPATMANAGWTPLLATPSHPEYVSGHSTFSGAAAEILAAWFHTDAVAFEATSIDVPGVTRRYRSFRACAEEIGMSRLYGGIHYRFSNADGLALGRGVAAAVLQRLPVDPAPPRPAR